MRLVKAINFVIDFPHKAMETLAFHQFTVEKLFYTPRRASHLTVSRSLSFLGPVEGRS